MATLRSNLKTHPFHGVSQPVAGVLAGVVAGAAYLLAQISFTGLAGSGVAAPLQRIAAILMGAATAPPPPALSFTVVGIALIIHFSLAIVYGRLICALVWNRRAGTATSIGAATGLVLFAVNFGWIAPMAFPWFADSLRLVTMADHVLFGALAAAVCITLREFRFRE